MRKILFILIILTKLNAQRTIPLQQLVIPAINPINPEGLSQDKIFVSKLIWGNHDKNTSSWILDELCTTCYQGHAGPYTCVSPCQKTADKFCPATTDKFLVLTQTVQFDKVGANRCTVGSDSITFKDTTIKNVEVSFPYGIVESSDQNTINHLHASIGVGNMVAGTGSRPFFEFLTNRNKLKNNVISFYLGEGIEQAILGDPQEYFKQGEWQVFNRPADKYAFADLASSYYVMTQKIEIIPYGKSFESIQEVVLDTTVILCQQIQQTDAGRVPLYGVFSSTSQFITFQNVNVLLHIVTIINEAGVGCYASGRYYICVAAKSVSQFPMLRFHLYSNSESTKTKYIDVQPQHYLEPFIQDGQTKYRLLLVGGKYQEQSSSLGMFGFNCIWFGYPVLRSNYVVFDYERQRIITAPIFEFKPQKLKMDKTFVHVIMIATSLTIFFAIIYLLNILKKVPYKPVQEKDVIYLSPRNIKQPSGTKLLMASPIQYSQQVVHYRKPSKI